MYAIIDFFIDIFNKIVSILNVKLFPDFNITFLQVLLCTVAIKFIFKFLFGGFKEIDTSANISLKNVSKSAYNLSHKDRKQQIVNNNSGERMVDVWGDGTYKVPYSKWSAK